MMIPPNMNEPVREQLYLRSADHPCSVQTAKRSKSWLAQNVGFKVQVCKMMAYVCDFMTGAFTANEIISVVMLEKRRFILFFLSLWVVPLGDIFSD